MVLPWVVEVVLACLNQQNRKVTIQVGEPAGWDTARASATADDDVNFIWDSHGAWYLASAIVADWEEY